MLGLVLLLPATGFAQSTSDIQSMINALMKQIQALQQQVNQQNQNSGGGQSAPILPQEKTETVKYGELVSSCRELRNTLRAGNKGQDVAYLHTILQKEGFTINPDELSSQEYGESTASSVTGLQEKYRSEILAPVGLKYGSGLVGASTRKKLNALYNCVKPIEVMPPYYGKVTVKVKADPSSIISDGKPGEATIYWNSQNAVQCNYEKSIVATEGSMQVTVRQTTNYSISCTGKDGSSAYDSVTIYFGSNYSSPPTISGVSGPTTLKTGEIGTWKINASSNYNDYLSYSVVWGDEIAYTTGSSVSSKQVVSQSATFEHSYQSAGTYNPIFYVTNQNGQSAKVSISVQVGTLGSETVTEQVKCVFEGDSTNKQNCYFASNNSNQSDYNALGCSGVGACVVDLKGIKGETRSWKSSCGGYAITTMDGQNEYAKFSCGTVTQPILQVLSPNGGESWQAGARQTIKWSAPLSVSNVKITLDKLYECNALPGVPCIALYSTQVLTIAEKIPNTGYYEWNIPTTLATGRYEIKVYDSANMAIDDGSNAPFTIVGTDKTYHPADTNKDLRITINEVTAYGNGQYATSASNIWRNGEVYKWDSVKQDWVPTTPTPTNSSIVIERMFVGQYDNTKYNIILSDPDGLHTVDVRRANGSVQISGAPVNGSPSCPTQTSSGVSTLSSSDFPLTAKIQDCKDPTVVNALQASMPAIPPTSTSLDVSSVSQMATTLDTMRSMLEGMLQRLMQ